jgi:hypothetical protein
MKSVDGTRHLCRPTQPAGTSATGVGRRSVTGYARCAESKPRGVRFSQACRRTQQAVELQQQRWQRKGTPLQPQLASYDPGKIQNVVEQRVERVPRGHDAPGRCRPASTSAVPRSNGRWRACPAGPQRRSAGPTWRPHADLHPLKSRLPSVQFAAPAPCRFRTALLRQLQHWRGKERPQEAAGDGRRSEPSKLHTECAVSPAPRP